MFFEQASSICIPVFLSVSYGGQVNGSPIARLRNLFLNQFQEAGVLCTGIFEDV
jgi:hypothetical protein